MTRTIAEIEAHIKSLKRRLQLKFDELRDDADEATARRIEREHASICDELDAEKAALAEAYRMVTQPSKIDESTRPWERFYLAPKEHCF
jgi:hypothetical protein